MRSLLTMGSVSRLMAASLMAICLTSPDAYGQARGGGRISTREDINRAEGGGGLQGVATNQAQAGGGLAVGGSSAAGGGGALSVGDSSAAGAGGGMAAKGESEADAALRAGGDLLGDSAKSTKGGGIAAADEGNFVRSMATWVPIIGAVVLGVAAWFLRNMKGKGV